MKLNDPVENQRIIDALHAIRRRRANEPVSYKRLLDEALEITDGLLMRAMAAEAKLHKISELVGDQ